MTTTSELNFSHTHMAPQDPHFGADEIWAAETLLMLSHGLRRPSSTEYRPPATTVPAATTTPKKPKIILRIKKTHFTSSSLPHVCDVCGASFASHQALGGHKTCHRPKNSAAAASGGGAADQEHECSDCQARFPTGQALGGHKRKHYEGMIVSAEKTKKREERMIKVLDFDLNLPYIQID